MDSAKRPVSPHIQIYRPQLTSVLSIMHRITGVGLGVSAIVLTIELFAIAYDREFFEASIQWLSGFWGRLFLFFWTLALFFHLCNGIRHLFWDVGRGLELEQVYRSGWGVIIGSLTLTVIVWTVGYTACG